ncbi:hypothetical protein AMTRI_Chr07g81460 [Amborella trichopoda]
MYSSSISRGVEGGSLVCAHKGLASDLLTTSFKGSHAIRLKDLGRTRVRIRQGFRVFAKIGKGKKHDYPWPDPDQVDPNVKGGHLSYLSHFKPLPEKPKPVTLPFEKPLVDLEKKINDVRKMADETGLDFTDQISSLESKYQQALKDLYTHLTPIQRLSIARHPNRPTFLDHVLNITDKWVELHGDRAGYDDPAIVSGIGSIDGKSYMFIGHQKGRNTKENIHRNFGMPTPHGYRKALRMMHYADHHGFPIITFIDTPGAYADIKSEELGQGEAIAHNLRTMFGLKVPIVSVVIGEGGSGGALAIGCSNKMLMLENAVFYVASPEACAAILWKTASASPKAAERLKITSSELCRIKIADGIIPEPLGGAHTDPDWTSQQIKIAVMEAMDELTQMDADTLLKHRYQKFRVIGGFQEGIPIDPERKRNMKKSDPVLLSTLDQEVEELKEKLQEAKKPLEVFTNLKQKVDKEIEEALESLGLKSKIEDLRQELAESGSPSDPSVKAKLEELTQEVIQCLPEELKQKVEALTRVTKVLPRVKKVLDERAEAERIKKEVNQVFGQEEAKEKIIILKEAREKGEQLQEAKKPLVNFTKLKQEVDKEIEEALESLGLNGRFKDLRKELAESGSPPDPGVKAKLGELIQEVDQCLPKELKQKVKALTILEKELDKRTKAERIKKEINQVFGREEVKEKIIALKEARQKGEQLDPDRTVEIENLKKGLVEVLGSLNVAVVPPNLGKVVVEIGKEIKKAAGLAGVGGKLAELKMELSKGEGADKNKAKELVLEIRREITKALDLEAIREKAGKAIGEKAGKAVEVLVEEPIGDNGESVDEEATSVSSAEITKALELKSIREKARKDVVVLVEEPVVDNGESVDEEAASVSSAEVELGLSNGYVGQGIIQ